jgi:hypothetical protein
MKNLKLITAFALLALFSFTSCQDEIDTDNGENPNTNTADSQTASNLERVSMYDGSFDDFLDGVSCSSILLPVTATVNGTQVTIVSEADYQQVIDIIAQFNDDNDEVLLQFPLTIQLSNYTELVVTSQSEYNAISQACQAVEQIAEDAISCVEVNYPITILNYNLNLEQTGSVVIESNQQLYAYINNLSDDTLFAVNYPITATISGDTATTIASDLELQVQINDCLGLESAQEEAEENAQQLEQLLVNGVYQIESFVDTSVDTASDYAEFTIDFANDMTLVAENIINATVQDVQGTYQVTSQTEVYLELNFAGNTSFSLLNHQWEVTSYNNTSISLQSTTNAAITLVLTQI